MNNQHTTGVPYPTLSGKENNNFYVSLPKNLYAGKDSELSAVLQYIYQTHYFEQINSNASDKIMQIAINEMNHLEELARAIIFFGGDPKYVSSKEMFFSAKCIDYEKDYSSMIISDMEFEKCIIKNYTDTASIVKNESLKKLLLRICFEQQQHYITLEKLLAEAIF